MSENIYTFTDSQLDRVLNEVILLRDEYASTHGQEKSLASTMAISDIIEGLELERELLEQGGKFIPSQIV